MKNRREDERLLGVTGTRRLLMGLLLALGVMLTQPVMATGPAPVSLGSCSKFAILGATAVSTDGGAGIINGDVGLSPGEGSSITVLTAANVNGTIYTTSAGGPAGEVVDAALLSTAQDDLTTAYLDAQGRTDGQVTMPGDIGGQTLTNGLYWSGSTLEITGDLILDALGDPNAVWIFQVSSALTTAAGPGVSRVILANGARASNVFWQVDTATLGSYSVFKGTIMAQISITMGVGSSMEGRALARTGAVTFNNTGSPVGTNGLPKSTQSITNLMPTNGASFAQTNLVGLS
ncbi:MAG: ice-binding family protein [bacterium]